MAATLPPSMKTNRLLSLALTLALTAAGVLADGPVARADILRTDGNDTKGPLDLSNVRLTPLKAADRFQVKTMSKFTASQLDGDKGWIEVDFDTNADTTYDFWVAVFYHKGKLIALQGHRSNTLRQLPARRVDARTISFDITHGQLDGVHSYDLAAFSIWRAAPCTQKKPCVDAIPNRYPLIRYDFTSPTVTWKNPPTMSTQASDTLTYPVSVVLKDDKYGSGIRSWSFQLSVDGSDWSTFKTGTSTTPTIQVPGESGHRYGYRMIAVDKQGNKETSKWQYNTLVPFDDRDPSLTYSAGVQSSRTGALEGTITSLAQTETLTYSATFSGNTGLTGEQFAIVMGKPATPGSTATATVSIDGVVQGTLTEDDNTSAMQIGEGFGPQSGLHTVVITTTSAEPFVIDGLYEYP
jgi:hypothetical protein